MGPFCRGGAYSNQHGLISFDFLILVCKIKPNSHYQVLVQILPIRFFGYVLGEKLSGLNMPSGRCIEHQRCTIPVMNSSYSNFDKRG